MKESYPSATGKLLCVLLNPGDGELLTYVTSGQGEHCKARFSFWWCVNNLTGTIKYPFSDLFFFNPDMFIMFLSILCLQPLLVLASC